MKYLKLFFRLGLCIACILVQEVRVSATTTITPEDRRGIALSSYLNIYSQMNNGVLPSSWDELIQGEPTLKASDARFESGNGLSEAYSFIAQDQRALFPLGQLIIARYEPVDWPSAWSSDGFAGIDLTALTEAQRSALQARIDKVRSGHRPIRYVLYQNKEGKILSEWMYEDEFQVIMETTGLVVPKPTPYFSKTSTNGGTRGTSVPGGINDGSAPSAIHTSPRGDTTTASPATLAFATSWKFPAILVTLVLAALAGWKLMARKP